MLLKELENLRFGDNKKNDHSQPSKKLKIFEPKQYEKYHLGGSYQNIYFTKREMDCIKLLLMGKTMNRVALELNISHRTVECYVKNMKTKLCCKTKFQLLELIYASELVKNVVNFDIACGAQ